MTQGRLASLDLTSGVLFFETIPEEVMANYLGGASLGAKLWLEKSRIEVDAMSSANALVVAPGCLTGYPVIAANRTSFVAKSPLTGLLSESTVGGYFGPYLRSSGFDALVLTGAAPKPSYILLESGQVKLMDAADLWGLDTFEVTQKLKERHGLDVEVASIGPAGENGVLFACVICGGKDSRAAGRTGVGAVMGAKNLKAIVVRRGAVPRSADPVALAESMRAFGARVREKTAQFGQYGTAGGVISAEASGDLPVRNWKEGSFPGAAKITGQAMHELGLVVRHYTCWGCPIHCGKDVKLPTGERAGHESHAPEYETIASFGSMCLVDDPAYVCAANDLANRLGLDTISAGSAVAFAMECFERGVIDESTPGRKLSFGDGEALLALLKDITYKHGLGSILARGVREAAKVLGPLAQEFAVHVKGLEVPYHDPRAYTSMAANYATCSRGACHLEGMTYYIESGAYPAALIGLESLKEDPSPAAKAKIAVTMQNFMVVFNSTGLCKFLLRAQVTPEEIASWISQTRGITMDAGSLIEAGERSFNMRRLANVALGITRKDDILPPRLYAHARPSGKAKGILPHFGAMLEEYYALREWDDAGLPRRSCLERLGLLETAKELGINGGILQP